MNAIQATNWKEKALRLQKHWDKYKSTGLAVAKRGTRAALGATGAAISGATRVYMPNVPGTAIETDLAAGAVITLIGAADLLGDYADELTAFGTGLLAPAISRRTEAALRAT